MPLGNIPKTLTPFSGIALVRVTHAAQDAERFRKDVERWFKNHGLDVVDLQSVVDVSKPRESDGTNGPRATIEGGVLPIPSVFEVGEVK